MKAWQEQEGAGKANREAQKLNEEQITKQRVECNCLTRHKAPATASVHTAADGGKEKRKPNSKKVKMEGATATASRKGTTRRTRKTSVSSTAVARTRRRRVSAASRSPSASPGRENDDADNSGSEQAVAEEELQQESGANGNNSSNGDDEKKGFCSELLRNTFDRVWGSGGCCSNNKSQCTTALYVTSAIVVAVAIAAAYFAARWYGYIGGGSIEKMYVRLLACSVLCCAVVCKLFCFLFLSLIFFVFALCYLHFSFSSSAGYCSKLQFFGFPLLFLGAFLVFSLAVLSRELCIHNRVLGCVVAVDLFTSCFHMAYKVTRLRRMVCVLFETILFGMVYCLPATCKHRLARGTHRLFNSQTVAMFWAQVLACSIFS